MSIRKLPDYIVNRISAGEVVDRPLSIIRELIDNSIDAKSTDIKIIIRNGGKSYICLVDNGIGMHKNDLEICTDQHTTSKLNHDDLFKINTLGFRGEALFSLSTVSTIEISTHFQRESYSIEVEYGLKKQIKSSNLSQGTKIEVSKLFMNTPARLKFLKPDTIEKKLIEDYIKSIAILYKDISFTLISDEKMIFSYKKSETIQERIAEILGEDFLRNSVLCEEESESEVGKYKISGMCSLPTLHKQNYSGYYIFINGRLIRDNIIISIINNIYRDYTPTGRYPILAIFIEIPNEDIDMNVHPAKSEVRFRNQKFLQNFISHALSKAISSSMHMCKSFDKHHLFKTGILSTDLTTGEVIQNHNLQCQSQHNYKNDITEKFISHIQSEEKINEFFKNSNGNEIDTSHFRLMKNFTKYGNESKSHTLMESQLHLAQKKYELGIPICQILSSYIICQAEDGIVIIDQHAAHERIIYERLKKSILERDSIQSERLLTPISISQNIDPAAIVILSRIGFEMNQKMDGIEILSIPSIMKQLDIKQIIIESINELDQDQLSSELMHKIERICASIACKTSIKAGRKLSMLEMQKLIEDMSNTSNSGQCNHGRPTNILITSCDIEKMFKRR
ncbi:DNA mismatch repair endonuclease MutL [Candidatus Gromoviella agglomerans]|uniref:DNA mismatch repair endonuclease MutL n=1 Tax=Candidatus Gromoviella agglomerans TaxID=2806609 RepID=UPI001E5F1302|nr:DNA mismatch repair endonuclease MutL [Candidatus Gromoviella agglomerans]UFX98334.1 DNA mismatch repair protein MutL [Candidatus Gromoviella agglomerans]